MSVQAQLVVYDTAGNRVAIVTRWRSLQIDRKVNQVGNLQVGLYSGDPAVQYLRQLDYIVEFRRRWPEAGIPWYTEFTAFTRTPEHQISEGNSRISTFYGRSLLDLVRRSSVLYYSDTPGSAKGPAPADDVIKELVSENIGPLALTSHARVRNHVFPGVSVAANTGQAASYTGAFAWRNTLDAVAEIGNANKVDFDVVWLGGALFEFRTYYPQQGTDRQEGTASPVIFAPYLQNMTSPTYTLSRTDEANVALVLGPGEGPLRDVTIRTGVGQTDSPWNDIEIDIDASGEDKLAALNALGDQALHDKRAAVTMTFQPIQQPQSAYGKHYFLGDVVTGVFDLPDGTLLKSGVKIVGVSINVSDLREKITLQLENIP